MSQAKRNDPCPCGSGKKYKKCCQLNEVTQPSQAATNTPSMETLLGLAVSHHQAGRLQEAEAIYRQILDIKPRHHDALHLLGLVAYRSANYATAVELISKAITIKPHAAMHFNLALVFEALGNIKKAEQAYRSAIKLDKKYAEAYNNLGNILVTHEKPQDAIESYRQAIKINPGYAEAYTNLGNVLRSAAQFDEACDCYRKALAHNPVSAEAQNNLGYLLQQHGDYEAALSCYLTAIGLDPGFINAQQNLASLYILQGNIEKALEVCRASLQLTSTDITRSLTVQCLKALDPASYNDDSRHLLLQAINEAWCPPRELVNPAISDIGRNTVIAAAIRQASSAWPRRLAVNALFTEPGPAIVFTHTVLQCLLIHAQLTDIGVERLLSCFRNDLLIGTAADSLAELDEDRLVFYSALARNCFINEYVFSLTADEAQKAGELKSLLAESIAQSRPVSAALVLCVASYFPLHQIAHAQALLQQQWSAPVLAVLVQQIEEPAKEQEYKAGITTLTSIENTVSRLVQDQYEQNPYPRWVKTPLLNDSLSVAGYIQQQFPLSVLKNPHRSGPLDILVAGCGTGQQPIHTARRFTDAQVLAIDLSASSLAYAIRKTNEYGLTNIEYAQADIMQLASMHRSFEMIESVGVLHHLDVPMAGLRQLVSLLRPGGIMYLGFYSALARSNVEAARNYITEKAYGSTAEDIRQCREDMMSADAGGKFDSLVTFGDFFGISECRDLLFHVHEHCFTIPQLQSMLAELELDFIGFLLRPEIAAQYTLRFPDDAPRTRLENWHAFELENPGTFAGMYQFYVQGNDKK